MSNRWAQAQAVRHSTVYEDASDDPEWSKRLSKAMHLAKSAPLELTRDERIELAQQVPGADKDLTSWKQLSKRQLDSLINMLEGWIFVTRIILDRSNHD